MILCGDIGGTKTVLALYERSDGALVQRDETRFPSRDHDRFESILERYLAEQRGVSIDAASFAVAGAVIGGRVAATNLPWVLEEQALARALGLERVRLLNDLEAAAYGMLELSPEQRFVLNPAREAGRRGNIAVIAAGTGLGEAYLIWDGQRHRAVASEGGHADFSPRTDEEIELLRFLRQELGRVSTERVLSGPGLHNIYRFQRQQGGEPEPEALRRRLEQEDPGAVIGELGLADADPVCRRSVELFASLYGAEAGDMALQCVAVGGVYLGGGIAPRLLPVLRSGEFMRSFADKGRFSDLLRGIEVSVALETRAPLLGAARQAAGAD